MNRCRIFFSLTAIFTISAICLSYFFQNSDVDSVTGATVVNDVKETTSGTWAEYEYMRLRNPQTGEIPRNINRKQEEFAQTLPTVESRRAKKSKKETNNYAYGWKSRGPHNIGGRTRALGIDIRDENIILAGGVSGGMWKSTDNGANWRKTTSSYQLHNISCVVQDTRPGHEDTWYYGTGEMSGGHDEARAFVPYRGDGIFKSNDNGNSWELLESTSTDRPEAMDQNLDWTWKMAIDPSNLFEDEVYVAAHGAIYRSINGGETWNVVLGGTGQAQIYTDVAVTSNGVVYAALCFGPAQGLYRSVDGINWTEITPVGWPSFFNRVLIAIVPSNENNVYFFTETTATWAQSVNNGTYAFWKYKYISGNGTGAGSEWDNRSSNMFHNYAGVGFCMSLNVYPENEDIIILGRQSMHRSRDGFRTLSAIDLIGDAGGTFFEDYGLHCDHHAMVFSQTNPKVAYVANDGGIAKTYDITAPVVEWTSLEYGYITSQYYTVAIPNIEGDPRIMGGMHDNGSYITDSYNPMEHWKFLLSGDGSFAAFVDNGTKMIVSWQEGNTYLYNRVPQSPSEEYIATRINPDIDRPLFINPIAVDPNNDRVVYMAGGYQLLRCSDITNIPLDGSNSNKPDYWQAISGGGWSPVTAIGISKQPENIVYYGTQYGGLYKLENSLSDSPVRTVLSISGTGLPGNAYVSNIAVHPHNADHIIVTYANYEVRSIFASNDG
ncbi:WD40/YVTN/BNR-like repeat-containing protein, partial [Bacteroidota bacterium]